MDDDQRPCIPIGLARLVVGAGLVAAVALFALRTLIRSLDQPPPGRDWGGLALAVCLALVGGAGLIGADRRWPAPRMALLLALLLSLLAGILIVPL